MGSGGQGQGGNWAQSQVAGLGGAPSWAGPAQSTASTIGTNTSPQAASNFATNAQSAQAQGQSSTPSPTGTTSANTPTSNVNNPMPTDAWTPMTANTPFIQQQVNAGLAGLPPDLVAHIQAQNPGQGLADYWNNNSSLASNNPAVNSQIRQMIGGGQLPSNWYTGPAAPGPAPNGWTSDPTTGMPMPVAPNPPPALGAPVLQPGTINSGGQATFAQMPAWASAMARGLPWTPSGVLPGTAMSPQFSGLYMPATPQANGAVQAPGPAGYSASGYGAGMGGSTQGAQTPSWLSGLLQQAGLNG